MRGRLNEVGLHCFQASTFGGAGASAQEDFNAALDAQNSLGARDASAALESYVDRYRTSLASFFGLSGFDTLALSGVWVAVAEILLRPR
eukprot:4631927-Amphidinium_carterae.5